MKRADDWHARALAEAIDAQKELDAAQSTAQAERERAEALEVALAAEFWLRNWKEAWDSAPPEQEPRIWKRIGKAKERAVAAEARCTKLEEQLQERKKL